MLRTFTIHTDAIDTDDVVAALVAAPEATAGEPLAGLLFASRGYDLEAIVRAVHARYPGIALVGASANGTMSAASYHEDGVLLTVLSGPGLTFAVGVGRDLRASSRGAARVAVDAAASGGARPALALTFADPLSGDMAQVVAGLAAAFGPQTPVLCGGAAADDWTFEGTALVAGEEVLRDAVVVLACFGPVVATGGVAAGWRAIGEPMTVTDSFGAEVRSLDGAAPRELLERRFPGFGIHDLLDHPLAVLQEPEGSEIAYLRALRALEPTSGAVTAFGSVPRGARVRLTIASSSEVIEAAVRATDDALAGLDGPPAALLVFSCAARQTVLGIMSERERAAIRARLAERGWGDAPIAGFYGYGEICGLGAEAPRFHNETCVVVALRSGHD